MAKCLGLPAVLKRAKISQNSPDETVRSRGVRYVLPKKAATGRRQSPEIGVSRRVTVVPNLFADDGRVHRFGAKDQSAISCFFYQNSATSALICGDTET